MQQTCMKHTLQSIRNTFNS